MVALFGLVAGAAVGGTVLTQGQRSGPGDTARSAAVTPTPGGSRPQRPAASAPTWSPLLVEAERAASDGTALRQLEDLVVRGRGPKTGYDRGQFGQRWADVDRNGCDTRNDVLRRDLQQVELDPVTRGCAVASGLLDDPYTGQMVPYARGADSDLHVDHVVALSDAWQKGAATWAPERRTRFANDPANLLAVSGRANLQKGDADAASWLPPRRAVRCAYVSAQVRVKAKYGVAVTRAEKAAVARVLASC